MRTQKIRGNRWRYFLAFVVAFLFTASFVYTEQACAQEQARILTPAQQRLKTKITYSCRDLPIDTVLMQLAEQARIDIIKSPKVTGNVTVKVTDAPLDEVLSNILSAHGYTHIATENMIRVVPLSEIVTATEKLVTRIYRITYADVGEVAKSLQKFISKRGEIASNKGTSNIMVTDIESKIKAIDNFIEEIDRITSQVLVEVRIYDVICKDRLDVGIEWDAARVTHWGESSEESVPFLTSEKARPLTGGAHEPYGVASFSGATHFAESTEGLLHFGILNPHINISAYLRMQKENVSATLLANPRVLVLDNETANFKIVSEIPYEERSEGGGDRTITTWKFKEVGVELQVTPHIARDGMIRLHILPEFGVVVGLNPAGAPTVDARKADTTLLVQDGQTVALGGLRKKKINTQINKIPLLGDLPLVGGLFKFEGEETIDSELIVFITPRIVTEPVLSEAEKSKFSRTEFSEPEMTKTRLERSRQ